MAMTLFGWRLLVGASGLGGYWLAAHGFGSGLRALSQEASLAAGASYLLLAVVGRLRPDRSWAWLRGALATLLGLVCGAYLTLLSGSLDTGASLLEHLVTPLLVVADVVLVGPLLAEPAGTMRWWWPVSWLLPPLAYLVAYVVGDFALYDFLDPGAASFAPTVGGLMVATLGFGLVVYAGRKALVPIRQSTYARDIS